MNSEANDLKQIQITSNNIKKKDRFAFILYFCGSILWIAGFIYPNQNDIDILSNNLSRAFGLIIYNGLIIYVKSERTSEPMDITINTKSINNISLRHILLSIYSFAFSQAHFYLPSPIVYTIFFSGPLFVLILEYILFRSKITREQIKGVISATIGILLTANGIMIYQSIFGIQDSKFQTKFDNYKTNDSLIKSLAALLLIILEIAWAYAAIVVRKVTALSNFEANFNFGIFLSIFVGFLYMLIEQCTFTGNFTQFLRCFLFSGIILAWSQACFMQALLLTDKRGIVAMIGFLGVIYSYILSVFRYEQQINLICLIGVTLVIFGIYKIVLKND